MPHVDAPSTIRRLDREWEHLRHDRSALAAVAGWSLPSVPVHSLDELLAAAGYGVVERGNHDDDEVLGCLVAAAATDLLAARIVLQRILPGVVALARRHGRHRTCGDALDDAIAAAWAVIRSYPIAERPSYVAANLLRRTEYHAFRRATRRRAEFVPVAPDHFDGLPSATVERCAGEQVQDLIDMAEALGWEPEDVELARRLARGDSTVAIARHFGVTDRAIRYRRAALAARLARLADAA